MKPTVNRLMMSLTTASLFTTLAFTALAHGNERGEAKATISGAKISIDYGTPQLKGRDPGKMLQPGQLWRLGKDAPTTMESDKDLDFGGTRVPKGKHILLARLVEPGKWTLVVSGQPASKYDPKAKIAEVPLELQPAQASVEVLEIHLTDRGGKGVLEIAWGTLRLVGSFGVAK